MSVRVEKLSQGWEMLSNTQDEVLDLEHRRYSINKKAGNLIKIEGTGGEGALAETMAVTGSAIYVSMLERIKIVKEELHQQLLAKHT